MLRYALRRLLWVLPSVLGISIIAFFVLSLIPETTTSEEARRQQFLDLPRFFNLEPDDVRSRTLRAVERLTEAAPRSAEERAAQSELVRLGGAALPVLLPRLDELEPEARVRVALGLAPLAIRMELEHRGEIYDPDAVVLFWNRFWAARGVELTADAARAAVSRYARYGTEARAHDVKVLDTFALPHLMAELEAPETVAELARARRLVGVIAHVADSDARIGPRDSPREATRIVARWKRWWLVYEPDFRRLVGAERVAAFALQTRYGKWVYQTIVLGLGEGRSGRPLGVELLERGKLTASILVPSLLFAYLLAVLIGALAAFRRGQSLDWALTALVLIPYALSPTVLAVLAVRWGLAPAAPYCWAVVLLSVVLVADPARQQREALLSALTSDHVRAAVARGAGPWRVVLFHGLRNAMLPVATRAALELPMAITACFVVERAFALPGLGAATLQAVEQRDVGWLMALSVVGAASAVLVLVLSDVAYAALDPRLRNALFAGQRGRR